MDKKALLLVWYLLCHFGNLADATLTLYAVSHGVREANPIMAWLLNISPFLFAVVKIIVFSLAIEFVAKRQQNFLKWIALFYMTVLSWHLSFVFTL